MNEEIGFVGLGNMGAPMAKRLLDAGYRLVVTDMREDARRAFEELGARAVGSAREVADAAETIFISLPTPVIVEAVATEAGGLIDGGAIKRVIDLSTTGATTSARVAEKLAEKRIAHLDAPVSGGKHGAEKGTLAVMASGPKAHFELVQAMLRNIGKVFFIGEAAGLAQTMKLVNNLLSATAMAATSEAVVMAVKAGIDPSIAVDVINVGSGRNSASQDKFPKAIIPRSFDYGFTTGLMYKDLKLCMQEAEALGVQMLVANSVKQLWQIVHTELGPDSDFTQVVQVPEQWAGVTVGTPADK
ncbi:NAD(P)-dependent oxidoreductase [Limoniibacter endophyticus]|uniref:Oxidoreductase n=1 Tax=Limoniibacter endophyticus TaxID=1565040 RepID=A0A8J3DUH4_9HYPH|nr:NAD(P)-dependent oxidoreductase [Limoniibacter endophyticus]GHC78221.1 oxidoreductase [Limoniibacter endophyticus]